MATNYIPNNYEEMISRLKQMMTGKFTHSVFNFAQWTNLLLNDRKLSDEYKYVLDRKGKERGLGNNLERPSLVNKRLFVRKTNVD